MVDSHQKGMSPSAFYTPRDATSAGVQYTLTELSASSFVQLQKIIHVHYVRFMPPLLSTALLSSVLWLAMIRSQWRTVEFWFVAIAACGILAIAAATRAIMFRSTIGS